MIFRQSKAEDWFVLVNVMQRQEVAATGVIHQSQHIFFLFN